MVFIEFHALLKEMMAAEHRYLETCACHTDTASQEKVKECRKRLEVFNELTMYTRSDAAFPEIHEYERILLATVERIAQEQGAVRDDHFRHVPEEFLLKL